MSISEAAHDSKDTLFVPIIIVQIIGWCVKVLIYPSIILKNVSHLVQFFDSAEGLRQHYIQSGDHAYCRFCSILFDDFDDLLEHGEEYHYVCRGCDRLFQTERELLSHKECSHNYCRDCDRFFRSKSNLEQHRESSVHKPRIINCVGRDHGCTKTFISISALVLHAESGTCPAGITRKQVNDFVVRNDRKNLITNPKRLLKDGSGSCYAPSEPEYRATVRSWNGSGYECYLCNREFSTLQALNVHLSSPKHAASIYRCPLSTCETEYSVLSALIQHVEWGNCGVRRNRQVENFMHDLTNKMKRITL